MKWADLEKQSMMVRMTGLPKSNGNIRLGETGDEVQGNMGPRATGDWEGTEQTGGRLMGRFGTGAHPTGRHKGPTVPVHGGPPEPLAKQKEGAGHPEVAMNLEACAHWRTRERTLNGM